MRSTRAWLLRREISSAGSTLTTTTREMSLELWRVTFWTLPQHWMVGNVIHVDAEGTRIVCGKSPEVSYERLIRNPDIVRQQPAFYRRALLERVKGWNAEFFMVMDFDLWTRLAKVGSPKMVDERLGLFSFARLNRKRGGATYSGRLERYAEF